MTQRRLSTIEETIAIAALRCCTFPVASWDKRFVRSLNAMSISEKESAQLWRLFKRYRRQIDCPRKNELLQLADKLAAPDLRKMQAEARAANEVRRRYEEAMRNNNGQSTSPNPDLAVAGSDVPVASSDT